MKRIVQSLLIGLVLAGGAEVFLRLSLRFGWPPVVDFVVAPGFLLRALFYPDGSPPEVLTAYTRQWMILQVVIDAVWYSLVTFVVLRGRARRISRRTLNLAPAAS